MIDMYKIADYSPVCKRLIELGACDIVVEGYTLAFNELHFKRFWLLQLQNEFDEFNLQPCVPSEADTRDNILVSTLYSDKRIVYRGTKLVSEEPSELKMAPAND